METTKAIELSELALSQTKKTTKQRYLLKTLIKTKGKHFKGIIGPRGVGKTILIKQLANITEASIYISLDSLIIDNLFELIQTLHSTYKYKTFFLDEIHALSNYAQYLKKIYDFLPVDLYFTSSVALSLFESSYDLSRRVQLYPMLGFSFGEFIYFETGNKLSELTINDIFNKAWSPEHLRYGYLFDNYLTGKNLPFSIDEPQPLKALENILDIVVHRDILSLKSIHISEIEIIKKMVSFIGKAQAEGISYSSLSKNLGISKYKAEQYVFLLEKAFVLKQVFPAGTNVLREPKILMFLPYRLLFRELSDCIGGLREDFLTEMLISKNFKFNYLKSTRGQKTPDFLIKENEKTWIVEVGGKGKGREQFKGIDEKKSIIFSHSNEVEGIKRPLHLIGF